MSWKHAANALVISWVRSGASGHRPWHLWLSSGGVDLYCCWNRGREPGDQGDRQGGAISAADVGPWPIHVGIITAQRALELS